MNAHISINGRKIGTDYAPYIIAEMSANHNGSIENAFKIIEQAKRCGADAVKLQTYTADTITLNSRAPEFMIRGTLWDGQSLHELYQKAHMPWDWHKPLFDFAHEQGITIFSSPFDFSAVDLPLIRYVAQTGKPMIISTGMADADEIAEAVETAKSAGCRELVVLHCVSGYPAPAADYNLRTLPDMAARFDTLVGLSDHTLDNTTAVASVVLGACVIEKHFTLDRNGGGADDSFSLEPDGLQALCRDSKTAWQALGRVHYGLKSSEQGNVQFRRSLYFVKDMQKGDAIDETCIRSVRPGFGIAPKHFDELIGKRLTRNVQANTKTDWADFE